MLYHGKSANCFAMVALHNSQLSHKLDQTTLKSREKAAIIDALKNKYPLPNLLEALNYARSSYYYQKKIEKRRDKYPEQKEQIRAIFEENHLCYGCRRIYLSLKKSGVRLSETVIRI